MHASSRKEDRGDFDDIECLFQRFVLERSQVLCCEASEVDRRLPGGGGVREHSTSPTQEAIYSHGRTEGQA